MSFNSLKKFHQLLLKTEAGLLIGLLLLMIVIAVIQIVMRNFMGAGLIWAESLLRITVLWLALLGAMVASRNDEHIAIDVLVNKLPQKLKTIMVRFTRAVTSFICIIVTWFSLKFVLDEYEYGGIAFGVIPHWLCEAIIPFSFFIMAVRYAISALVIDLPETRK
ncbi:MAG: TRAP transporter small permease [Methylococcaceae bacterium]|nr:TRAP transporter small permease [Methylococcaceae bacterium]